MPSRVVFFFQIAGAGSHETTALDPPQSNEADSHISTEISPLHLSFVWWAEVGGYLLWHKPRRPHVRHADPPVAPPPPHTHFLSVYFFRTFLCYG